MNNAFSMNNSNNDLKVRNSAKINGMIYHELWLGGTINKDFSNIIDSSKYELFNKQKN